MIATFVHHQIIITFPLNNMDLEIMLSIQREGPCASHKFQKYYYHYLVLMRVVEQEELNHLFAHRKEANSNATEYKRSKEHCNTSKEHLCAYEGKIYEFHFFWLSKCLKTNHLQTETIVTEIILILLYCFCTQNLLRKRKLGSDVFKMIFTLNVH